MKIFFIFFILIASLNSCNKTGNVNTALSGTYTGNFQSFTGILGGTKYPVQITFTGNNFNGDSSSFDYQSICKGTYLHTNSSDSIQFVNGCIFPAIFIFRTFILDGSYKMIRKGDSLYFRRTIGDLVYEEEVYSLRKQ